MMIAIMQPYLFPYIGYFQLIHSVETFIFADDLNFIKNGFINKNSILAEGKPYKISLQLFAASQNKRINEIQVGDNGEKLLRIIESRYRKTPYYNNVYPLLETILLNQEKNLARFIGFSLTEISDYLEIQPNFFYSSELEKDNSLKFDARIMDICNRLKADHYINPIGGQKLYDKSKFAQEGIKLSFINTKLIEYKQFDNPFVPNLSIIDVMMFNSKETINKMLDYYELI